MPIRPQARPLAPAASGDSANVHIKVLIDRQMDAAIREYVTKRNITRSAYVRKLIERDLKRNRVL